MSEGFDGGTLGCSPTCTFVTSMCFDCGDGVVNGTEDCDGTALGGATCMSEGFDGGTLGCSPTCTFVTSMCFDCGDGVINGSEQCDGTALGGQTCMSQGFTAGPLACSPTCTFDTTMCTTCGDGMAQGAEECDGADLRMATCASRGFASGVLSCSSACTYDASMCSSVPAPAAGQLVITEIQRDPTAVADAVGEYFELLNTSGGPLNLAGCVFTGTGGATDTFTIPSTLLLPAGGRPVFAASSSPGFAPTFAWPAGTFALANTVSDGITITCGGVVIDTVVYDPTSFPIMAGTSMSLSPTATDATANDSGANWCLSVSTYGAGTPPDRGTPGAANDACSLPVGFCRLQFPPTIVTMAGASTTVYGRVYVAGLTDRTGINDPDPRVIGQVGYGADGTDPTVGWTWASAMPNPSYSPFSPGYEMNNDEYEATLIAPSMGTYDYAFRFSGDRGLTWLYCDLDGATSISEYSPAQAGAMTVSGVVTGPNLYFSEYIEGSSNNKVLEIYNAGTGAVDLSTCAIRLYTNGAVTFTSLALAGTLSPGAVFVVCNNSTVGTVTCDLRSTSGVMGFNGDDALELVCGTPAATMDVIGQIGLDPGTEWGTGLTSTADNTLQRSCSVTTGDVNGADAFDPSVQWTGFATDTFSGLGSRGCP
jgi:hypothetical protein